MSIGSIVSLVAGKLGDLLVQEAKLLYGVKDEVQSLQDELMMMNSFLKDMDEEGGDERTLTTIKQIRKMAYDAEDVIDDYILAVNVRADKTQNFFKRHVVLAGSSLPQTHEVASKIQAIKVRISDTMERWTKYADQKGIIIRADAGAGLNRGRWRRQTAYPHTSEEHVVGLEEDIIKLVGVLTTDATKIQVVSTVGMGGSGKTTLARKLYNHESIKRHFDCFAWVSISEEWVPHQVLLELFRKASGQETTEAWIHQVLVEKLHGYLESKSYLIVLDDVWEKEALEEIIPALPIDGGKIIVTTRKHEVTDFPDLKCYIHEPRRLTEEESWELFRKIALIHREQSNSSVLETLGKEMLKKCEGLPLAVIALAGILGKKETLEEWERVKTAVSSWIVEEGRGTLLYGPVNKLLGLSYNDLRPELKTCFLYLAMFPEDHVILTGQLVRMWIAEGFITSNMLQEGETFEDVARDCLEELIQRCVVQIASRNYEGKVKSIRVHDVVRDLCVKKSKEQDFLQIFTPQSSNSNANGAELRRSAIYSFDKMYLPLPIQSHHLRSLVYQSTGDVFKDNQRLRMQDVCENFRLLRVLILQSIATRYRSLPTGIGGLIHLRYLRLRWTNISELPSSIGNLRNLLTLDCKYWSTGKSPKDDDEFRIPNSLWEIEGLRHLCLPNNTSNKGRVKLHTLKQLQTLRGIRGGSWMLEELPHLSPTVQKLDIYGIESEEQLEAVLRCPSITSDDSLQSLRLKWFVNSREGVAVMLEKLQHLRKLCLHGRIKDTLSSFNQFPTSIIKLELESTWFEEEASLAALSKLPNLTFLQLGFYSYMGTKWTWIAGQFSKLKNLQLHNLRNWEEWSIEKGAMPQLTKLRIESCSKLRRLPEGLIFINTLQEIFIWEEEGGELEKRIKGGGEDGGGEDAHIVQYVPRVQISQYSSVCSQEPPKFFFYK